MISSVEAAQITQAAKDRLANPQQVRCDAFIKEAEAKIRDAADRGQNRVSWKVGTREFVTDITNALQAARIRCFLCSIQFYCDLVKIIPNLLPD